MAATEAPLAHLEGGLTLDSHGEGNKKETGASWARPGLWTVSGVPDGGPRAHFPPDYEAYLQSPNSPVGAGKMTVLSLQIRMLRPREGEEPA